MKIPALLIALLLVLTAASTLGLLPPVSVEQQERNRLQWLAMPEHERERLRQDWAELNREPPEVQLVVMRRLATLDRLRSRPAQGSEQARTDAEVVTALKGVADRLSRLLEVPPEGTAADIAAELRARTRHRIDAFLDGLVEENRLTPAEREELGRATWEDLVRRALEIQKAEEIFLYSEFSSRREATQLEALPPLDVIDEMLQMRRLRGFLGQAGVVLGLSEQEQLLLAATPDEEFFLTAKRLMEPKAREYMSTRLDMSDEQIDRVLSRPYRHVERSLHRLVKGEL